MVDLVCLVTHAISSITRNGSNIAEMNEPEGALRGNEQGIKEIDCRVKIAENAFHSVTEVAVSIFMALELQNAQRRRGRMRKNRLSLVCLSTL